MNKLVNQLLKLFLLFGIVSCFMACSHKKPKPVFDLNHKGAEVVAEYEDSSPNVVVYYKVDDKGNKTQDVVGVSYFYENKQEHKGGGMKDGKREGKWYAFFKDGAVQTEAFYINGKEHGAYNVYRENGTPIFKGHYDHGICDGTWYFYDETGKQKDKIIADKNTIACEYCPKCLQLIQN